MVTNMTSQPNSPRGRLGSVVGSLKTEIHKTSWLTDFSVEKTIGRGKFAVVKMCVEKTSGRKFAAKCIRKRRHCRDCTPDIFHEIAVLEMSSNHPHLIDLHRVYESPSEVVLILEYAAGGEIFDYCVGVKDTFNRTTSKRLIRQILEAVHFLHKNEIVHLDLKPQNILLTHENDRADIKLVDFGLSKCVANSLEIREIAGTPDYVAPEVLNFEPITTATDIWSLGVVSYVMLTGVSPFLGDTKQETLMNVTTAQLDFPDDLFDEDDHHCKDFIAKMLQRDPSERLTAEDCLKHPFLSAVAISRIILKESNSPDEVFSENESSSSSESDSESYDDDRNNNVIVSNDKELETNKENIKSWSCDQNCAKNEPKSELPKPRINRLSLAASRAFSQDENNALNLNLLPKSHSTSDNELSPTNSEQILKKRKFDVVTPEKPALLASE